MAALRVAICVYICILTMIVVGQTVVTASLGVEFELTTFSKADEDLSITTLAVKVVAATGLEVKISVPSSCQAETLICPWFQFDLIVICIYTFVDEPLCVLVHITFIELEVVVRFTNIAFAF